MCTDALKTEWKTVLLGNLKEMPIEGKTPEQLVENVLEVLQMSFSGSPTPLAEFAGYAKSKMGDFDFGKVGAKKDAKSVSKEILKQLLALKTDAQKELESLINEF